MSKRKQTSEDDLLDLFLLDDPVGQLMEAEERARHEAEFLGYEVARPGTIRRGRNAVFVGTVGTVGRGIR